MINNMPCNLKDFDSESKECGLCRIVNEKDYRYCKKIEDQKTTIKQVYEMLNECPHKKLKVKASTLNLIDNYDSCIINSFRKSNIIEDYFKCTCKEKTNRSCKEEISCFKYFLENKSCMTESEIKQEVIELVKLEKEIKSIFTIKEVLF